MLLQSFMLLIMIEYSRNQYEYKVLPLDSKHLTETELNRVGRAGWRLVATLPCIIFERDISVGGAIQGTGPAAMLLSIKEAAASLGISRSLVYRLIAAGQLKVVRIGRSVRVPRSALEGLVLEQLGQ